MLDNNKDYKFILSDEFGVYQVLTNIAKSPNKVCDVCKEHHHTYCKIFNRKNNKTVLICEDCLKENKIKIYHKGEDLDLTKVSSLIEDLIKYYLEFINNETLFKKYFICHYNNIQILKKYIGNYILPKNEYGKNCSYLELVAKYLNCIFTICYNAKKYNDDSEINKEPEEEALLYYKLLNDWINLFNNKYKASLFIPDLSLINENKLKYEDKFNMVKNCIEIYEYEHIEELSLNLIYNQVNKIFNCNEYTIKNVFESLKNNKNEKNAFAVLCTIPDNEYAASICLSYLFNKRTKKTEEMEYLIEFAKSLLNKLNEKISENKSIREHIETIIPYLEEALNERKQEIEEKTKRSEYIKNLKEKSREVKTRKRKVKYE